MIEALIVGGGVMGCASALALSRRGVRVCVLERSVPGAEASSAAAGMLAAQVEARRPGAFLRMCVASRARFPEWAALLHELTGIDVQFRTCGVLRVAQSASSLTELEEMAEAQRAEGLVAHVLDGSAVRELEPHLGDVPGAVHFPDDARVDPPSLLKALRIGAERSGAEFRSGALVRKILVEGGRARGVLLEDGERVDAEQVVLAAGSWSTLVEGSALAPSAVRPARGQILELASAMPCLRGVVFGDGVYLSPRDDGRVLVGSTLEFVGFRRGVTAGAVRDLLSRALALVPALVDAELCRTWSSFRPYTADELPLIGPSDVDGLILATGHYRNGILLGPLTGEIVACCVTGSRPPIDLAPFSAKRPLPPREVSLS